MMAIAPRHKIIVIVPVADRPRHLSNILASLLELCHTFPYGDSDNGRMCQVAAVVADDSADEAAIARHQTIASDVDAQGMPTLYFGAAEQAQLLHALPAAQRHALRGVVGEQESSGFRHKGASVTRNLASLMAGQMCAADEPCLFMFVDSDEQFKVRIADSPRDRDVMAIDYFGCLDRIFASGTVDVLTGKVVGDPPVSPAVMAGNFLVDVVGLLEAMSGMDPMLPCTFHGKGEVADDAAYHDMAELFGFTPTTRPFNYRCTLHGSHNHAQCLTDFAEKLDRFFDGEHPTRSSTYAPGANCTDTRPARTVYTGNYVCNRAGLAHFIPFAPLKLRMAGPVLGRLIRADIGPRFVSANLPLLHTRTVDGDAEFRAGVRRTATDVDLSDELERQYFGDVMLFGVEHLIESGYPMAVPDPLSIRRILDKTEHELRHKYAAKRELVASRLDDASKRFDATDAWWNRMDSCAEARVRFHRFFANLENNFGVASSGQQLIVDPVHREKRLIELTEALLHLPQDRAAWRSASGFSS